MDDLERLRRFVTRDEDTLHDLDALSLCWVGPEGRDPWDDCPPPPDDGVLFADTGGESEYYLMPDGAVVLYVPLADTPHVVVGGSIREWLGLAVDRGFVLDGLAYDWDSGVAELQGPPWREELDEPDRRLLDELAAELDLQPWPDVPGRLAELQQRIA